MFAYLEYIESFFNHAVSASLKRVRTDIAYSPREEEIAKAMGL